MGKLQKTQTSDVWSGIKQLTGLQREIMKMTTMSSDLAALPRTPTLTTIRTITTSTGPHIMVSQVMRRLERLKLQREAAGPDQSWCPEGAHQPVLQYLSNMSLHFERVPVSNTGQPVALSDHRPIEVR